MIDNHEEPSSAKPSSIDDPPETVAELRARMHRLRRECERPSYPALIAASRDGDGTMLAKATLSEFVRDIHPQRWPKRDFVRAFVRAHLVCAGAPPEEIQAVVRNFDAGYTDLCVRLGQPPSGPVPAARDAEEEPEAASSLAAALPAPAESARTAATDDAADAPVRVRRWPRRLAVGVALVVAAAAGFAVGVQVTTGWSYPFSPDPSLAFGPCAEAIGPSTRVGSTAFRTEIGPHGVPRQDRQIELRIQKHPDRGWIAWSRLERTTSPLDRLWLDWSYFRTPGDKSQYRQCGSQMATENPESPALLVDDEQGRQRWFRACGQVPTEDRAPDRSGTFCTDWSRPHT